MPAGSSRPGEAGGANNMDNEGKPQKDLANELESLREEIAHLQSLIQNPIIESATPEITKDLDTGRGDALAARLARKRTLRHGSD